jgi:protein gp37
MGNEFNVNYDLVNNGLGEGKTIFIEHLNDLFSGTGEGVGVPDEYIDRVLAHCRKYPNHTYVYQTKNPARYLVWINDFPKNSILGTTIESNFYYDCMGNAPEPASRMAAMCKLPNTFRTFLTIEPVMAFDLDEFSKWIIKINPTFINLGADSKDNNLEEPTVAEIMALVNKLHEFGIELREKGNLSRLKA